MTASLPDLLTLSADDLVLEIAPDVGGSFSALFSLTDGPRHDWLRPASLDALRERDPTGMASFPLVPYCNRLRNGRFHFDGVQVNLPRNTPTSAHPLHGTGWLAPWQVLASDSRQAILEFTYPGGDWPFPFVAQQDIQLAPDRVTVRMSVRNTGNRPMPLGFGHHPYFPHRPGTVVQTEVSHIWAGDHEVMPTGLEQPPFLTTLREGALLADLVLDNNFVGWSRRATVRWPDRGTAVTMTSEAPFDYFVLYSPAGKDHFCMEPVSNCTDWLNLEGYPQAVLGGQVLAPGETVTGGFELRLEGAPPAA